MRDEISYREGQIGDREKTIGDIKQWIDRELGDGKREIEELEGEISI